MNNKRTVELYWDSHNWFVEFREENDTQYQRTYPTMLALCEPVARWVVKGFAPHPTE